MIRADFPIITTVSPLLANEWSQFAARQLFWPVINKLRAVFGRVVVGAGLHVPHGEHGDLSSEAQGEHERAIFHDRHDRVVEVWVHHLSVSFLLKRGLARGKPRSSRSR